MERKIVLSSYSLKNTGNNKPGNFITRFNRPIVLDGNYEYVVGLNRVINMSFTWTNINQGYNNQLIKYSSDGGTTFHNIFFPAGVWTYKDFEEEIKYITKTGTDKNPVYIITLQFDTTTI